MEAVRIPTLKRVLSSWAARATTLEQSKRR
jgi:hypothetical protein